MVALGSGVIFHCINYHESVDPNRDVTFRAGVLRMFRYTDVSHYVVVLKMKAQVCGRLHLLWLFSR